MKRILLVDDHPEYSSLLAANLKIHGFETFCAQDGMKAIELAETGKPDLILLDIMMPQMGGAEIRAELLKRPQTKNIPIIFLTGLRPPQYPGRQKKGGPARAAGPRTVGKSSDIKELLDAIRSAIQETK